MTKRTSIPTFNNLCKSLAESEMMLRRNRVGNASIRGVLHGRHAQLEVMKEHYPAAFKRYSSDLLKRLESPFDSQTMLSAIKSDEWALQAEMLDYELEMAVVNK